jgi:hypothetical protein
MRREPMAKTVHVVPFGKGWAVKGERASKRGAFFFTQKDAVAGARFIIRKRASGQIVVHGKTGRIHASEVHGLPKIQKPPVKSSLGSKNIEKAVSELAQQRLASA